MSTSTRTGRIAYGLDCNNLCEICKRSRNKGSHVKCAKKRAEIYRDKGRKDV